MQFLFFFKIISLKVFDLISKLRFPNFHSFVNRYHIICLSINTALFVYQKQSWTTLKLLTWVVLHSIVLTDQMQEENLVDLELL